MSVARVAQRVQRGGHYVPEETVRRRYERGLWNLFNLTITEVFDAGTPIDNAIKEAVRLFSWR